MSEFIEYIGENLFAPAVHFFQLMPAPITDIIVSVLSIATIVFGFKIIRRTMQ